MIRYKIEEICGDWAIYEVRETETEGGERCLLVLNSRANAEYIKAILEHELRYPNAAVPYRTEVADMSDAECVAVNHLCCAGGYQCHACPVQSTEDEEAKCFDIERRVLAMAEKYLKYQDAIGEFESIEDIKAKYRKQVPNVAEPKLHNLFASFEGRPRTLADQGMEFARELAPHPLSKENEDILEIFEAADDAIKEICLMCGVRIACFGKYAATRKKYMTKVVWQMFGVEVPAPTEKGETDENT